MGNDKAVKAGNTNIKIKLTPVDRSFYVVVDVYLAICGIIVLLPLLHVLAQSLSDPMMVIAGRVSFFPINPTLDIYSQVIKSKNIMTGFMNTLFYAGVGTCLNLFMTVICAYPLARKGLWGRKVIVFIFTFTMMFGGGMIPTYLVIKQLGLIDTRAVMILPGAITVWNMIMCRTYFMSSIPEELYESASLDGASDIRILVSMVVPLSVPILAVMVLFYAVGHWNSYFDAMIYLNSPELYNIQPGSAQRHQQRQVHIRKWRQRHGQHGQKRGQRRSHQVRAYSHNHDSGNDNLSVRTKVLYQGHHDWTYKGLKLFSDNNKTKEVTQ